jgi:hypothetical protein
MDPFRSLISQLPAPRKTAPRDEAIEVEYTITRTYRPRGKTLTMIRALRAHGAPMTSAELGSAAGVETKQVPSMLAIPLRVGLVTLDCGDQPVKWEAL